MKLNAKTIQDLIDSIPIVKLLSKNVGAAGAIGFIIQDFVLPLYGDFIVPIVLSLAGAGLIAFALWYFIFKIDTSDNFNHVSFQASIVCVLLSIVIFGFSFLSKALSGEDGRGLLGSQVGFVADLQDNANVYKEDAAALAKIAENYSDMQMQLATLNNQIANQMSQNGQLDDDLKSQISEIMSTSVPGNNDSSRVTQLEKELDIAYELLRQMSMNNQVLQSDEKDDFKDKVQQAKNDSIFSIIGSLNSQIESLEEVSSSMLTDIKSLDKSAELAELKTLTLEIIEKEDQLTKTIQESEKRANKTMRKELDEISSSIRKRNNKGDKESEKYLDEIVSSYEKVLSKVENRKSRKDERSTEKQLAETQKEIDDLKGKLVDYESAQSEDEANEELSSLKTLISQLESYNDVQTSNVETLQKDTQSQIGELTSSMSQILNDITDLKAMIVNSGNNIQSKPPSDEVEITSTFVGNNTLMSEESQMLLAGMSNNETQQNQLANDNVVAKAFNDEIKVLDNQQSDLYYKKAQMLIISNNFEESLDNAFKVIELSPERLEAYTLIGNIYMTAINRCSDIGEDQFSKKLVAIAAYKMYEKSQNDQKMNEAMMFFPTTDEIKSSGYSKSKSVDLNVCWVNEEITLLSKGD
tara:strand:+ start:164 stop:2080 length:1917 start_codon:yes stop_codon:yes gene_type:complete